MNSLEKKFPQEFWNENFGVSRIVALNEFISVFQNFIEKYGNSRITEKQKEFLKSILDPNSISTLTFLEVDNFFTNFWLIPQQRKLFFDLAKRNTADYKNEETVSSRIVILKCPKSSLMNGNSFKLTTNQLLEEGNINTREIFLKERNCLTIGSSVSDSDLTLNDDPFIQAKSLKIILGKDKLQIRDISSNSRAKFHLMNSHLLLDCHQKIIFGNSVEFTIINISPSLKSERKRNFNISSTKNRQKIKDLYSEHIPELVLRQRDKTMNNEFNEFNEKQRKYSEIKSIKQYRDILEKNEYGSNQFDELGSKLIVFQISNPSIVSYNREYLDIMEIRDDKLIIMADSKYDFIIGRDAECDIVIKSLSVSKNHCRLWYEKENGWKIKNLDNSNPFGISVYIANSEQIQKKIPSYPHEIKYQSVVSVGEYMIEISKLN